MTQRLSRREFLGSAGAAAVLPRIRASAETRLPSAASDQPARASSKTRIVDMHVHFDDQRANFIPDLLKLSDRLNLTACLLTPFANRKVVADAAKEHQRQIVPFGFVDLDATDVVQQVEVRPAGGGTARDGLPRAWRTGICEEAVQRSVVFSGV